jgi:hypothetical protein
VTRGALALGAALAALAAGGCGGGSGGSLAPPSIGGAKTTRLGSFQPTSAVPAGRPVTVSFDILQPSGRPLTRFATGPGPHTGVHLIIVREDLSSISHFHPPVSTSGMLSQRVTFPSPGPYRVLVDVYARASGPVPYQNYQLFSTIHVRGAYHPRPIGALRRTTTVDGWTFTIRPPVPKLRVGQAAILHVDVRNTAGQPAHFEPWYGALAHAVFFHERTLHYFHTHVCAPHSSGCSGVGPAPGSSTTPGVLNVGVLVPDPGTWRLFLQTEIDGRRVTAPFTLMVAP